MVARNTREQVRRVDTPAVAPVLITDGALVTADAVWAWVLVPIASTFLAEEDDLDQATLATARSLAAVLPPGVDYHLKVIPAPHTGDAYRASWAGFSGVRSVNAEHYIDLGSHRIDLNAAPGAATQAYGRLLERLDQAEFPVALAMLWALERAYLDAWSFAAPGAGTYRDFVAHWTTPEFGAYVSALEAAANDTPSPGATLDAPFIEVVEAEVQFWDMAVEGLS